MSNNWREHEEKGGEEDIDEEGQDLTEPLVSRRRARAEIPRPRL